jgi:hypothetical protein
MEKEATPLVEFPDANDPVQALRSRLGKPGLSERLRKGIKNHVTITSVPSVSGDGKLVVPHGGGG